MADSIIAIAKLDLLASEAWPPAQILAQPIDIEWDNLMQVVKEMRSEPDPISWRNVALILDLDHTTVRSFFFPYFERFFLFWFCS